MDTKIANIKQRKVGNYIKELARVLLRIHGQNTLQAQFVKGISGSFVLQMGWIGLVFATSIILARLLGAKGYGSYAYAISWIGLLSIPAVMGLPTLLTREVSRYKTRSDWGSLRGLLRWSNRVVLLVSSGLALATAVFVWIFKDHFEPQTAASLWIGITFLPFFAFIHLRQGAIQGFGHVVAAQLPFLLILPVLFLTLIVTLRFISGLNAPLAVGMRALAAMAAFLIGSFLLKKQSCGHTEEVPLEYHSREWLRSAFPLFFVGATSVASQEISIVIVGSILGPEAAGVYQVASRGATLVVFVLMAVNMPLAPTVASFVTRGEMERLQRVVTKSARVALLGSLPIALGLVIFGRWVLLIFGKEFIGGDKVLAILCLGHLVNVGMGSVALILNMTGHELVTAKGIGIATVVNVILSTALIPIMGIEGAAVGNAISIATWNILLAIEVYKRIGIYSAAFSPVIRRSLNFKL